MQLQTLDHRMQAEIFSHWWDVWAPDLQLSQEAGKCYKYAIHHCRKMETKLGVRESILSCMPWPHAQNKKVCPPV